MGKGLNAALVVLGLGLVVWAVTADATGIASGGSAFGTEQKLGVAAGMTVAWIAALALAGWSPRARRNPQAKKAQPVTPVSA
jgi:hypothetical protein